MYAHPSLVAAHGQRDGERRQNRGQQKLQEVDTRQSTKHDLAEEVALLKLW
jgi:hypothetical protein